MDASSQEAVTDRLVAQADARPVEVDPKAEPGNETESHAPTLAAGTGAYPERKGTILVTPDKYKGIIPTGHAAIVYTRSQVIEALSGGVTTGRNDWNRARKQAYGVSVKDTDAGQDARAADWTAQQKGKPYNWQYLNTGVRHKFYCSQLVWAAFKDKYGVDMNTNDYGRAVHPMELVNNSHARLVYRKS